MDTSRKLYEIELALAKSDHFNFVRNIVAFNVHGLSDSLAIFHECDMLVLSKAGYLTEIEIKRSYSDFLADFKKDHQHEGRGLIKYFYYCVPGSLLDKVYDKLTEEKRDYTGIITYDEDLKLKLHGFRYEDHMGKIAYRFIEQYPHRKLFLEEQLQVARFGAMRAVMLKEKLLEKEVK